MAESIKKRTSKLNIKCMHSQITVSNLTAHEQNKLHTRETLLVDFLPCVLNV